MTLRKTNTHFYSNISQKQNQLFKNQISECIIEENEMYNDERINNQNDDIIIVNEID